MAQQTMYPAMANSPQTELAADIDAAVTTITVVNGDALPAAPNLAVIGTGEDAETILYTGKTGNDLSGVTRGFQSVAKSWQAGSKVARYFTAYDHDAFRSNIADHETRLAVTESTLSAATNAATPNTIARRDANGRFKAAAPLAADDVARKAEVDAVPYNAYRQAIINGNFDVWQRGISWTNPINTQFTADRFHLQVFADGGTLPVVTHSRDQLLGGELPGSFYCYNIQTNGAGSGLGPNADYELRQKIEHGTRYLCGAGKKITVSFWARTSIPGKRIGVWAHQHYGTGGSPSLLDQISGESFTLTSTWAKYSATLTTQSLLGKTFGSNNDDFLAICLALMWGADKASRVGASGAETFGGAGEIEIAQLQVNAGEAALPFQPRSFAEELALCQRYYEKTYNYADPPGAVTGNGMVTALSKSAYILADCGPFKVEKRIKPTMTVYSPSGASGKVALFDNGTDVTVTGIEFQSTSHAGRVAVSSGGAVEGTYQFHWAADAEI